MERHFDPYDFTGMSDDEIYDVVVEHLGEYPQLDMGWVDVSVRGGRVTLSGRVASDAEVQIAENALVERMGLQGVVNELVVDELHRGEAPEAGAMGDAPGQPAIEYQSDTAAHLEENLEAQTFGTQDMSTAIEEGAPYSPPDGPHADGYNSREDH